MSEAEALRERLVAAAKAWVVAYSLIEDGVSDEEYADADLDFMQEAQQLAHALLELEEH